MHASVLDGAVWADVCDWLEKPENVRRLLAEWVQKERNAEKSIASRLEAAGAVITTLREKMGRLAETIADTSDRESRRVLQENLDGYAAQLRAEEGKRERLLGEAHDAVEQAQDARDVREWVAQVAARAPSFTRAEQVAALRALGARVTVWRKDHVHEDGWPQRYRITLNWSGFTGKAVTLPAHTGASPESDNCFLARLR